MENYAVNDLTTFNITLKHIRVSKTWSISIFLSFIRVPLCCVKMLNMRTSPFLNDCQVGCSTKSCLAAFLLFSLTFSPLMKHRAAHVSVR